MELCILPIIVLSCLPWSIQPTNVLGVDSMANLIADSWTITLVGVKMFVHLAMVNGLVHYREVHAVYTDHAAFVYLVWQKSPFPNQTRNGARRYGIVRRRTIEC